jgi:hypothetical protein
MGKKEGKTYEGVRQRRKFVQADAKNKELLLEMLGTEKKLVHSDEIQGLYRELGTATLRVEKIIYKRILDAFGFSSCTGSINNYINAHILGGHYVSNLVYDPEIMSAAPRLAKNKWLYRATSGPSVGGIFPNCVAYTLDGKQMGILDHIRLVHPWANTVFICGASSS